MSFFVHNWDDESFPFFFLNNSVFRFFFLFITNTDHTFVILAYIPRPEAVFVACYAYFDDSPSLLGGHLSAFTGRLLSFSYTYICCSEHRVSFAIIKSIITPLPLLLVDRS